MFTAYGPEQLVLGSVATIYGWIFSLWRWTGKHSMTFLPDGMMSCAYIDLVFVLVYVTLLF